MHHLVRRSAAVLAAPALSLTALAATSAPAAAAADPAPASASAAWLAGQLTNGVLHNDQYAFDDYGLSIDAGLALHEVGGQTAAVDAISDALAAHVVDYTKPGWGTNVAAGGTAKALAFAQAAGDDPTSYGGVDLVAQLEDLVASGALAGRIQDDVDSTQPGAADYANVIGQAYAAQGLAAAGSAAADEVSDFLLDQQCAGGWFRLNFSAPGAADQSCDADPTATADTDVTAIAVLALRGQADDSEVATHLAAAKTWLLEAQRPNGSFGGGTSTEVPNANSTGLAGWALGTLGATDAAAEAAGWVRAHQAVKVANCVYYTAADLGAIAYDNAAQKSIQGGAAIDATAQDQFRRSTAQALPALQWAPAGTGEPHALFAAEYVRAGGFKPVGVIDAAPGEALCAMLGEQSVLGYADQDGEAQLKVRIPATTGKSRVSVANAAGTVGKVTINALGKKKLDLTLKARVAPGAKQVLKVRGLAPGEQVSVSIEWPSKRGNSAGEASGGQANRKGVFVARAKVPNHPGKATVKVRGQFGNRKAAGSFTVTR